ncbi:polysaccharide deacetylase family protein [Agromyces silvae]|uniref:polysaccharide deacetylase family protein n=1 Tax=Agromyces silvae TaxID=3388266 RepID=UPI00280B5E6C|nr:polysaccharide deacetylase family protein [Agromyces protaetiae]
MLGSAALVTAAVLATSLLATAAPAAALEGAPTVVSLTFDDSNANQNTAASILNANNLDGTFYATTGFVGQPGYQTRADLEALAAAGHEIAGHSVSHPDMATLTPTEARAQACQSRATLTAWGFQVTSFAYPYASLNATAKQAVVDCGYNTARNLGDIETRFGCSGCGFAEAVPPADPFELRVPDQVDSTWTLADLQNTVINAENTGGGWIGLTFHHICDDCDVEGLNVSPALFTQFVQWLAARPATHNTSVKTVHQVFGGAVKPVTGTTFPPAPAPGVNGIKNPSLEELGTNGVPDCFMLAGYGTNAPTFSRVSPGRTGNVAEQVVMANYVDGDAKTIMTMDFGSCAPTVTEGHQYSLRTWYTSTVVTQFAVYLRNGVGGWVYWTSSPWFAPAAAYTQAIWDSPPIPAGYNGISFGLNLFSNGQLVTDDYELYDLSGAPTTTVPGTPTITGTAQVGQVLTANPGTWTPAPSTYTYQWLRNGTAITGATNATYAPVAADVGTTLTVRVSGTPAGATAASATSAGVTVTAAPVTVTPGTPTITGTPRVGSVLTANPGTWSPAGLGFTYQWLRNGTAIAGATAQTYTAVAADAGTTVSVRVTGTPAGGTGVSATSSGVAVTAVTVTPGTPTISGTPRVGSVLTANPGTWSPTGLTFTYQWLRNGTAIAGATARTYTAVAADAGATLSVRVTGAPAGGTGASATSAGVVVVATVTPGTPTISGTARVGGVLTANPGTWSPTGVALTYQWLRNGSPIAGATARTYTLVTADWLSMISVRVTGTVTGATATRTSGSILILRLR